MSDILEAIKDLIEFGLGLIYKRTKPVAQSDNFAEPILIEPKPVVATNPPAQSLLISPDVSLGVKGYEDGYITSFNARVWQRPVLTLDGEVEHLAYATKIEVIGYEGRFAHVRHNNQTGYVLKDEVTVVREEIFPKFNNAEIYSANHPETKKLRKLHQDEFATTELFLPLLDIEFVSYILRQQGKMLPWDQTRPRLSGLWQNILKGKSRIQISISPKTGSIIEYVKVDGTGFVGYVSSVSVDETITVSGVGRLIAGEYREENLEKVVWQEWRPVFIQIV